MSKDLKKYGGMDRFECREVLVKDIKEHDDLIKIEDIKTGVNESSISFYNGSKIITLPYSENALGIKLPTSIVI